MANFKVLATIVLVAIQILQTTAMDAKCNGLDIKLTEEQIMNIKECAKQVGIKSAESMTADQIACMSKCVLVKKGLIDDQGKPHKENMMKMLDASMPAPIREDLKKVLEKCLDEHGDKIKADDPNCMSFSPLAICVHTAFMGICKP